jgi:DNA-binding Xre family transcriptional regulator
MKEICYKRLWKLLIDKDLKKKDLAAVATISQSSVAKMSRGETISMDVLLKICTALDCDISDICEAIPAKQEAPEIKEKKDENNR